MCERGSHYGTGLYGPVSTLKKRSLALGLRLIHEDSQFWISSLVDFFKLSADQQDVSL